MLLENSKEESDRRARLQRLADLFKFTQSLPQVQEITEEAIAAEVAAYRATRQ